MKIFEIVLFVSIALFLVWGFTDRELAKAREESNKNFENSVICGTSCKDTFCINGMNCILSTSIVNETSDHIDCECNITQGLTKDSPQIIKYISKNK